MKEEGQPTFACGRSARREFETLQLLLVEQTEQVEMLQHADVTFGELKRRRVLRPVITGQAGRRLLLHEGIVDDIPRPAKCLRANKGSGR
jgi:hypothetical protein